MHQLNLNNLDVVFTANPNQDEIKISYLKQ